MNHESYKFPKLLAENQHKSSGFPHLLILFIRTHVVYPQPTQRKNTDQTRKADSSLNPLNFTPSQRAPNPIAKPARKKHPPNKKRRRLLIKPLNIHTCTESTLPHSKSCQKQMLLTMPPGFSLYQLIYRIDYAKS